MAWWRRHSSEPRHCRRCNGTDEVHRGLCRHCRALLLAEETPGGEGRVVTPGDEPLPPPPDLEPPHSRPWVHRGGG